MRVADDPARQREEPGIDSPLQSSHAGFGLRALGLVLLLFALGAVPLVLPDLRSGHHLYVSIVAGVVALALVALLLGSWLRARTGGS